MILEQANRIIKDAQAPGAGSLAPQVCIYVINLDRSRERWEKLCGQAARYGLNVIRVAAIDGAKIPEGDRIDFQQQQFVYHNGRKLLAGNTAAIAAICSPFSNSSTAATRWRSSWKMMSSSMKG